MLAVAAILKRLTAAIAALDPYFNNVSLLITGNGVDGSGNKTFIDSAGGLPISIGAGQPTQGSFNPFNSNYAGVFDGNSSLIVTRDASFIPVANENFTIEAWVYITATPSVQGAQIAGLQEYGSNSDWVFGIDSNLKSYFYINAITTTFTSTNTIALSTWNHVAVSRSGTGSNNLKLFINGIESGSGTTNSTTVGNGSNNLIIGADSANDESKLTGQISNLRIVKGYALYTSNFTPQAILSNAPLGVPLSAVSLLTLQDGAFVDLSVNNRAISAVGTPKLQPIQTSYPSYRTYDVTKNNAVYFSGTTSYLSTPSNAALAVGTNNFTIEFWIYFNSVTGTPGIFSTGSPVSQQNGNLFLQFKGTPTIQPYIGVIGTSEVTFGTWTPVANTWYHLAIVRSSTSTNGVTCYINGVSVGSNTLATDITTQNGAYLGGTWQNSYLNGYLSNFRFVKGAALYTSNFTPPKEPLTTTSNGGATSSVAPTGAQTTLLTCQSNTIVDNSVNNLTLTPTGTLSIASGPRYNAYLPAYDPNTCNSVYLSSADYISTPTNSSLFDLAASNYTVEFWIYKTATDATNGNTILHFNAGAAQGTNIWVTAGGQLRVDNGANQVSDITPIDNNRWYHLAIVRSSTTTSVYKDGVLAGSNIYSPNTSDRLFIGKFNASGPTNFIGYISNLRFSKGQVLYTSNFTPPVEPFTTTFNGGATPSVALTAANQVTLLACRSTTIKDDSSNALTLTTTGNPIVTNRNPFVLNTTSPNTAPINTPAYDSTLHNSVYFDGSSYLYTGTNTNLQLGTSQFTVECWFYRLGDGSHATTFETILDFRTTDNNSLAFAVGTKSTGQVNTFAIPTGVSNTDRGAFALNGWNHLAIVNDGTNFRFFINGIQTQTASVGTSNYTQGGITIGRANTGVTGGAYSFNGYVSNVRVIKGSALYTSNFTPSISGLTSTAQTSLLACQDSTIRDNSSNNLALSTVGNPTVTTLNPFGVNYSDYKGGFYGGSGYFDGSSYLTPQVSNIADFGTSNFTIEFWFNSNTTGVVKTLLDSRDSGTDENILLNLNASNTVEFSTGNTLRITSNTTIVAGAWYHFALTKTGGTTRMFINGVQQTTTFPDTTTYKSGTNRPIIGATGYTLGVQLFNGYISNLRIIKGSALYTANFAPPTAPVRPTSNTSLLLNFSNAGVYDVTRKNNLIQYGTASVSTSASKFGGGAMYFNGSTDYLAIPANDSLLLGTGVFTIEFWVYPTVAGTGAVGMMGIGGASLGSLEVYYVKDTQKTRFNIYSGSNIVSTGTLPYNTWSHVAYVREGTGTNQFKIYINGILDTTATLADNLNKNTPTIGRPYSDSNDKEYFGGYIDDLRITKGVARYTANFAVPTRELPSSNITLPDGDTYFNNVSLLLRGDGLSGAQNNTFLDSSVNNLTITRSGSATQGSFSPFSTLGNVYNVGVNGGSGYFDGSSYLTVADNTALRFSTGSFSIEFWFNSTDSASYRSLISNEVSNSGLGIYLNSGTVNDGKINIWRSGSNIVTSTLKYNDGVWHHLAFVRDSNGARLYIDGSLIGAQITSEASTSYDSNSTWYIGDWKDVNRKYNGYFSNLRIVKGVALYTSNFTPPTAPVTLTSNGGATPSTAPTAAQTSLLLNFTNAGIFDATGKNNLVTVGNARVDTATKKYGSGSIFLNNTSTIFTANDTACNFGTNPFTVEFWLYPTSNTEANYWLLCDTKDGFQAGTQTSSTFTAGLAYTGDRVTINKLPQVNTWTHIAIVRSGTGANQMGIYYNGILQGTGTSSENYRSGILKIGGRPDNCNGYIDDLRITKNIARYTSNFTPPPAPLPIEAQQTGMTFIDSFTIEYLIVAGGGGSGNYDGGGGGAGGLLTSSTTVTNSKSYTITVGSGGSGAPANSSGVNGTNGGDSIFGSLTAKGGGGGGTNTPTTDGSSGGSGGGAGGNGSKSGGGGTAGQGNSGGNSGTPGAGGGGGAGGAGGNGGSNGGAGGAGVSSSITGTATTYAGGGGGGTFSSGTGGSGGSGGGGRGADAGVDNATAGTENTGGGGGGSSVQANAGKSGGSGIVVLAYRNIYPDLIVSGLTYTLDTSTRAGYKVYKFTAGTGTITVSVK